MADFLTNLAEGIIDPQGFVAQRRQDRDMDRYLRAVGAAQQAPPTQQAAPQQQQLPTPFHMERLAGQFPASEGQIVPTLMQGRPAVLPASLPSAPDDPWKKAEVAKHEQSIGMIQQDQSLSPHQKMHAIGRIGEQMDALDPQRQYRRSSPGAQMTRGERFVAENVVPRYHPTTGEYMGDLILDGKGGAQFHQHKPEKNTDDSAQKQSQQQQERADKFAEQQRENAIRHEKERRQRYSDLRTKPVTEGSDLEKKVRYRSHDEAMKLMEDEDRAMDEHYQRLPPAATLGKPLLIPKPSAFLKTLHAQPKLSLEEAKKAAAQKPRVVPPPRPKVDPYDASGNVPMGSY